MPVRKIYSGRAFIIYLPARGMGPRTGNKYTYSFYNTISLRFPKGRWPLWQSPETESLARVRGEQPRRNPCVYLISTIPIAADASTIHGTLSLNFHSIMNAIMPMTMGCHAT